MDINTENMTGIGIRRVADLTFIKLEDDIFKVDKDRRDRYPKNYYVTVHTVVEELNNHNLRVAVLDSRQSRIVDNFENYVAPPISDETINRLNQSLQEGMDEVV